MKRWRPGESVEENSVGMGIFEGIFKIPLTGLDKRPGAGQSGKEFDASVDAQGSENILAVAVTLVDGGRGSTGRLGDATHGEAFLSPAGPEPARGVQYALFKLRIGLSGQRPASVPSDDCMGPVALTVYN